LAIRKASFEADKTSEEVAVSPTTIMDFTVSPSKKKSSSGTEEAPMLNGKNIENTIIESIISPLLISTPTSIHYFFFI